MIIESLRLFYHLRCFRCVVCHVQLGNGSTGTDVRVRNNKLHCQNCYSNDEGNAVHFCKVLIDWFTRFLFRSQIQQSVRERDDEYASLWFSIKKTEVEDESFFKVFCTLVLQKCLLFSNKTLWPNFKKFKLFIDITLWQVLQWLIMQCDQYGNISVWLGSH